MTSSNLHRELAPVSQAAWAEIEEEATRTFTRNIAGRRIVDVPEARGTDFSALSTGHRSTSAEVSETTDHGYPVLEHIQRVVQDGRIIWAPALKGGMVLSLRGGDYELHLGQDLSIGYDSHDAEHVHLYLQESFAFRVASDEAGVALSQ